MIDYDIVGDNREEDWTPMKVTAHMGEPIVYYGDGLHFDGILAYAAYLDWISDHGRYSLPPISDAWALDFNLPLAKWAMRSPVQDNTDKRLLTPDGLLWGWCASEATGQWDAEGIHNVRQYPPYKQFRRYTTIKSHQPGVGPMKAKDLPLPTKFSHEIQWYALGDIEHVSILLESISHIGKITHHGMGHVLKWSIEQMGDDRSIEHNGRIMRRMPWSYAQHKHSNMASIRPPYHHMSRYVLSVEADHD